MKLLTSHVKLVSLRVSFVVCMPPQLGVYPKDVRSEGGCMRVQALRRTGGGDWIST